jgi:hypothetical protein
LVKIGQSHLPPKEFNDHQFSAQELLNSLVKKFLPPQHQESIKNDRRQTNLHFRESSIKPKESKLNFHGIDTTTCSITNLNSFRESVRTVTKICIEFRKILPPYKIPTIPVSELCLLSQIILLFRPNSKNASQKLETNLKVSVDQLLATDRDLYWKRKKADFKNMIVIKKCIEFRKKLLVASKCKICEEETPLECLADHSFKCFARKSLHQELDRINRKIINKIAAAAKKTHSALRKPKMT